MTTRRQLLVVDALRGRSGGPVDQLAVDAAPIDPRRPMRWRRPSTDRFALHADDLDDPADRLLRALGRAGPVGGTDRDRRAATPTSRMEL